MNYCAQCGHKLSGDEHFCPVCGTPVKAGTSAVQAAPAKANLTSAQATPAKAVRPVLNKRILRVVDFFNGKALPFHDADCVSLCGRTSFLPRLPKIYYLLMMVDGECTKKEMQKFTAICKSCRISENDQKAAIVYCEGNVSDDCVQRIVTLNAELKNVTDSLQNDALTQIPTRRERHPVANPATNARWVVPCTRTVTNPHRSFMAAARCIWALSWRWTVPAKVPQTPGRF